MVEASVPALSSDTIADFGEDGNAAERGVNDGSDMDGDTEAG